MPRKNIVNAHLDTLRTMRTQGLSLCEIARRTGLPRTSIRDCLRGTVVPERENADADAIADYIIERGLGYMVAWAKRECQGVDRKRRVRYNG